MDADARRILELLGSAVERAEQVGVQQQALLQRQEQSAEAFSQQIEAAELERTHLLKTREEFAALREAEIAQSREEADAILKGALAEEQAARTRISDLKKEQAKREAEHAARMAQAERERAEAEAAYLERLREREAEHAKKLQIEQAQRELEHTARMLQADCERAEAESAHLQRLREREAEHAEKLEKAEREHQIRVAQLQEQGLASLAKRERSFEEACTNERARLQTLASKEEELQKRVAEIHKITEDGPDVFVQLRVGGQLFETTVSCITRYPNSLLATLWYNHRKGDDPEGPVRVNGDPGHFQLILEYLRCPEQLPVVADSSQLEWMERQAEYYMLEELSQLCQGAKKRINSAQVMQLLNGQKNLSGMDMQRLDLSDIDFGGASMFRSRVDEANLSDALVRSANLQHASFCLCRAERADFSSSKMEHAKLVGAELTEASFIGVHANKADFSNAKMEQANFSSAFLDGANLSGIVARKTDWSKANLAGAKIDGAELMEASFIEAQASQADFSNAKMEQANFSSAFLDGANLSGVVARKTDWSKANLTGAKIDGAELTEASFIGANASKANFSKSNLEKANLRGAVLNRADLSDANFAGCDLSGARLHNAVLANTDLRKANLENANMQGCSLTFDVSQRQANGEILDLGWPTAFPSGFLMKGASLQLKGFSTHMRSDSWGGTHFQTAEWAFPAPAGRFTLRCASVRFAEGKSLPSDSVLTIQTAPSQDGPWKEYFQTKLRQSDALERYSPPRLPGIGGLIKITVHASLSIEEMEMEFQCDSGGLF